MPFERGAIWRPKAPEDSRCFACCSRSPPSPVAPSGEVGRWSLGEGPRSARVFCQVHAFQQHAMDYRKGSDPSNYSQFEGEEKDEISFETLQLGGLLINGSEAHSVLLEGWPRTCRGWNGGGCAGCESINQLFPALLQRTLHCAAVARCLC